MNEVDNVAQLTRNMIDIRSSCSNIDIAAATYRIWLRIYHTLDNLYNGLLEDIPIITQLLSIRAPPNTRFIDPTGVRMPKRASIGSAALVGLTGV